MTRKETKRKGQRKAKRHTARKNPQKKRRLVPLAVASYLTRGPSNFNCMQITRSNNNGSNLVEFAVIKNKNRPLTIIR
jgi:hypothetical protein